MGAPRRVGFLGLGMMGSRMAANLAAAGCSVTAWTNTPGKATAWAAEHGASAAETPAEVASTTEIVISMVVDGPQVEQVLTGPGGVADGAEEGLLCVDMTTISPVETRAIGAKLAERGVAMIDAPVTGSAPRAKDGTLTIMVGGKERDFERARPLLEIMGEVIVHVGALGQGEMLKLINNALGAANAAAVAEALILAQATGIDVEALATVTKTGAGGSAQMNMKWQAMSSHDYTPLFRTAHLLKDVRLCLEEAQAAGVPFPAAAHARQLLAAAVGRGHGAEDYASIVEAAEGLAGRRL